LNAGAPSWVHPSAPNFMSMSQTYAGTASDVFTIAHAKHLASKVTTDMTRCHQLYGYPATLAEIDTFGTELALLLKAGYLHRYEFGFKKDEKRVLTWLYEVQGTTLEGGDQRPGGLVAGINIVGASAFNILTRSMAYFELTPEQKLTFDKTLPIQRPNGTSPTDGAGAWIEERSYSAANKLVTRKNFRPY
jgi:Bacterial HORMA domain family 1